MADVKVIVKVVVDGNEVAKRKVKGQVTDRREAIALRNQTFFAVSEMHSQLAGVRL